MVAANQRAIFIGFNANTSALESSHLGDFRHEEAYRAAAAFLQAGTSLAVPPVGVVLRGNNRNGCFVPVAPGDRRAVKSQALNGDSGNLDFL